MSVLRVIHYFLVTKALCLYYNTLVLISFAVKKLKNPFSDPWALKLNLVPPASLTDPKYGVHKYIKVNLTKSFRYDKQKSFNRTIVNIAEDNLGSVQYNKFPLQYKNKGDISLSNVVLHYVECGNPSKPLMIFVHGFPEFWYSWRHQIVEFSKDYWCIAIDMRGYGDSERPEGVSSYKLELLVEDLRDLVRQLDREKCIIVSHDWGGIISSKFRDVYPEVCNAVILLCSTSLETMYQVLWNDPKQRKMSWYIFLYQMPFIPEKLLQMDNLAVFDKMMYVPGKDTVTKNDIECYKYWFGKQHTLTAPVNYYRANFSYSEPKKQRCEKKVPFLVALAENDHFISRGTLDIIKQYYACIETTVIDGCSHFAQQEEPAKVNKLIREFLSKHNL